MIASCSHFQIFKFRNFYFLFCYLFPISCHSNPQLMSVPRCGNIIVDLALKFNSTTKEQNVIITLNDYMKDGKLGEFSVGAIKEKKPGVEPTGGGATSPLDRSHGGKSSQHFIPKLINECPRPVLGCKRIFFGLKVTIIFNSKLLL